MIGGRTPGRRHGIDRYARGRPEAPAASDTTGFPLTGELIDGPSTATWLINVLSQTTTPVALCSGFLRSEALRELLKTAHSELTGKILVRWRLGDLISGASDLEAYEVARESGLEFFIRLDFHGKVFCIPDQGIVLGSANATPSGLGLHRSPNSEVCTLVSPTAANIQIVEALFSDSHRVDDALFAQLAAAVVQKGDDLKSSNEWPPEIQWRLEATEPATKLLVADCFWSQPPNPHDDDMSSEQRRDFELLGIGQHTHDDALLLKAFTASRMYRWLVGYLNKNDCVSYFGALTAALHDNLLDDPCPARRDVKSLLQNLLLWCQRLPGCSIQVDQPNQSQRVRLFPPQR